MIKIALAIVTLNLIAIQVQCQTACKTPLPCANNQPCYNINGKDTCSCSSAWVGTYCNLTNPCTAKPCKYGACFPVIQTVLGSEQAMYYCQCYSGFYGTNCELSTTPCGSNPCLNGGICLNVPSGYTCSCVGQYTGPTCGTYIDLCANMVCQNGGLCKPDIVNQIGVCECLADFYGPLCEFKRDNCVDYNNNNRSICQNGATCLNLIDGYVCQCAPGWAGDVCNIPQSTNPCLANPNLCTNGKICNPTTANALGYECICPIGYFGSNTCLPDPCVSRPCKNKCVPVEVGNAGCPCQGSASYVCVCNPGDPVEYAGNC